MGLCTESDNQIELALTDVPEKIFSAPIPVTRTRSPGSHGNYDVITGSPVS